MDEVQKILCAISITEEEKSELDENKLKDVAYVWYKMWVDGRAPREVSITWDILKSALLERLFTGEKIKDKVEDFINLHRGGMSDKE